MRRGAITVVTATANRHIEHGGASFRDRRELAARRQPAFRRRLGNVLLSSIAAGPTAVSV